MSLNRVPCKPGMAQDLQPQRDYCQMAREPDAQPVQEFKNNVIYRKTDAMRELTVGTGTYVNEAVSENPRWETDFLGPDSNYEYLGR